MCVVKLNGPEWLPRAQDTCWPCETSMYLRMLQCGDRLPAVHGMEWPLPALWGGLTATRGGVASCFCLVEEEAVSFPWGHWGSMALSVCPDCPSLFSVSPGYVARWRGDSSTWRTVPIFQPCISGSCLYLYLYACICIYICWRLP